MAPASLDFRNHPSDDLRRRPACHGKSAGGEARSQAAHLAGAARWSPGEVVAEFLGSYIHI